MKNLSVILKKLLRLTITIVQALLLFLGLSSAKDYSRPTYGCGNNDVIAADPKTAIIFLLLSVPLVFFIAINISQLLKRDESLPKKWYTKLWIQLILSIIIVLVATGAAIGSPFVMSGYCF